MQILPTIRHICSEVSYENLTIYQNILLTSSVMVFFISFQVESTDKDSSHKSVSKHL